MLTDLDKQFLNFIKEGKFKEAGDFLLSVGELSRIAKEEYLNTIGFKQKYKHLISLDTDERIGVYTMAIACYLESLPELPLSSFCSSFMAFSDSDSGLSSTEALSSLASLLKLYCTKTGESI